MPHNHVLRPQPKPQPRPGKQAEAQMAPESLADRIKRQHADKLSRDLAVAKEKGLVRHISQIVLDESGMTPPEQVNFCHGSPEDREIFEAVKPLIEPFEPPLLCEAHPIIRQALDAIISR